MSSTYMSRPFSTAIINSIQALSINTTLGYVIDDMGSVVWPPAMSLELRLKFPYIFIKISYDSQSLVSLVDT